MPKAPVGSRGKASATVLRLPDGAPAEVHDALDSYRRAKLREKSARDEADTARQVLVGPARETFARAWAAGRARPAAPLKLANHRGNALSLIVEDPKAPTLSDAVRVELLPLLGPDSSRQLTRCTTHEIDAAVLNAPGVLAEVRRVIAGSRLSDAQKKALLRPVHRWLPRHSLNGLLTDLARRDPADLAAALEVLAPVCKTRLEA